jgi:hypothetical protein
VTDTNVIKFNPKESALIWVCGCGCTVMYHYADGKIECGSCEALQDPQTGDWRKRLPLVSDDAPDLDGTNFKVTMLDSAEVFMKRRAPMVHSAALIAIVDEDGASSTWSRSFETPERVEWLDRQLAGIRSRLVK